ncbi:MAG: hypothetical protein DWQ05_15665 [Calditrichaeota bacterium]|nr:MAG: hypothetical protein DWQ05_15665 [Calditrichota bacterium]
MEQIQKTSKLAILAGSVLIVFGIFLLFDRLNIWHISEFIFNWWPLLLIALGIKMAFFKDNNQGKNTIHFNRFSPYNFAESIQQDGSSKVFESRILGDVSRRITSKKFSGGTFFCIAGDIEIDCREMRLAAGQWIMHVDAILGDIQVHLPSNLPVLVQAQCAAGDVRLRESVGHGLFVKRQYKSEGFEEAVNKLVISTSVLLGDIKVD